MKTLLSHDNPKLKQVRLLRQVKQRRETGLFIVEGIRHVGEAVQAGAHIEYILYSPDLLNSDFARSLIEQQEKAGFPCYALPKETFVSVAEKENPQGILAVVKQRWSQLDELKPANFPWGVALVAPQDPGNIGAILRSIDAVGASGLLLLEHSADPYHPNAVRASMGSLFWHPLVSASFQEFTDWAGKLGYNVYGTSAHGSVDYLSLESYPKPSILLMGSEREGLSEKQKAACSQLVRMPMLGRVTSLNLAVASGVMLYHMLEKMQV